MKDLGDGDDLDSFLQEAKWIHKLGESFFMEPF